MNGIVKTTYPLSYGQKAMWFIYQIAPESVAYNIFITVKINLHLNIAAVNRVWEKIIEHHPILRTTYTSHEGKPVQQIHQKYKFNLEVIDASNWSEDHLKENIFAITDRPFNLEKDLVLRVNLFTRSAKEHILLLTMHHIAGDMWSFDLLLSEFQALYANEIEQVSQEQTEAAADYLSENKSYLEFVHWQSEMLSGSRGQKLWQYWQQQLVGELPILNLLKDKSRPTVKTYQGTAHIFKLDEQLIQKLNHLALASGTSLYKVLLAAFYVQLYRYTNQTDILIASPMRGRWGREFKEIVGYFVNLIVLRTSVQENATFTEFLAQVSNTVKQAQNHQYYPFSVLAEKIQPQRDPSLSPLCQVSFTWQRHRWCESTENSLHSEEQVLQMEPYLLGHQRGADFDLNLMVMEAQGVLQLCWQYNTNLFEATTITRMAGHFVTLLEGIVANPIQQIWQLPLLTSVEQRQLLVEWNDTAAVYPKDKCIHQLFEEQVELTPDAVAVVFEKQQLTYLQLNTRANQLAHYLQSLGVKPEVLVGICVERSVEMIVGLLGILKAGGAYVPLDPTYPAERLSYMLDDSGVEVLLTQQELLSSLPSSTAQTVCLDRDWGVIELQSQFNLNTGIGSDNLAYVIYTSGSTGQPKGVLVEHKNVVRLFAATQSWYNFNENDVWTNFHSIAFDFSVWEIWGALIYGGRLVIVPYWISRETQSFHNLLCCEKVTVLNQTPSAFRQLISVQESHNKQSKLSLRLVIFGGEALELQSLKPWFEQHGQESPQLVNMYGITETTVHVTYRPLTINDLNSSGSVIGRPIPDSEMYILNDNLQPVPIGITGQMYVGGYGLARGYLNRPELTSERFISNPFGVGRLYKTGDLARYLPDGNIEFQGRIDNQVKIRGFRIELGEIEAVLSQHPVVLQTVVIAREDVVGDKRLVAYLVVKAEQVPSPSELRGFLKQQLPEYMVPAAFVTLDTLPLTPNGKIDKKALPIPDGVYQEQEYVAPRTPSEEIIANIFASILGVKNVGIHDNFFTLGGHSLLATQLISRLRVALDVEIPLRAVFESPTVTQLDQTITQLRTQDRGLTLPPIQAIEGNREELPLSWAQERLWFLNQLEGSTATYNIPVAVRIAGNLDINALQQALSEIVRRHEILRTSFPTVNGTPRQVIHPEATMNINMVDLQQLAGTERETVEKQLAREEAITPFSLENAPLIRCSLLQLSANEYVLLLTMHHIVSDGWSMGVFIQELSAIYSAFCAQVPSELPELSLQYADFAVWQRKCLSGVVRETQLNYWRDQLHDAPSLLQLPTDRPRPTVQTHRGKTQSWTLNTDLTQKLQTLSAESGTTLFMTLYTAFATLLYRYSGQSDILIGFPIANRNRSEIESLIGFFVNTLVLRTRLSANLSMKCLLAQVRETTLQAYEHQDVPFEQVVEALQPQRSLSHSPLFQVMFVLQNAPMGEVELPGVTLCQLERSSTIAKFDLTLSITETSQGLVGEWEYNTDLFDGSTIERMAGHFQNLLSAIVENPLAPVSELPLLSAAERHQLLVEWNDTAAVYPKDQCIHQLFEEQVELTPDAVAVVFEQQQLTYQQLNTRANQLAHYLQSLGVEPEVLVGICVERSVEMVVGLLGILKAGGAYVPLDPNYPAERLAYILSDACVSLLLTQQQLLPNLTKYDGRVVYLEEHWDDNNLSNPHSGVRANNLAYTVYTSGSTGRPKGVQIEHRSLLNLVQWHQKAFAVSAQDRVTQIAGVAFDAFGWEIFPTLSAGASIYFADEETRLEPDALQDWLVSKEITISFLPTPLAEKILLLDWSNNVALRTLLTGGDKLHQYPLASHPFAVVNNYGPTENTVVTTSGHVPVQLTNQSTPAIGRPIANTQVYLLDDRLQPVPIGVIGEIYIGGDGLARGYLNRPELTDEKFLPNPFAQSKQNSRLYKTGDLARYRADSNIEYIGRGDDQVKIRGFRIELGEIEAVLSQHPVVLQTVVIAREDVVGDKRLVAYLVVKAEQVPSPSELRGFLKQQLPEYMVPAAFVTLDTLPLTPNGKIDKKALPIPDGVYQEQEYVAPRTPSEEIIANIFASILGVKNVGIHDNFFTLGGHSLLATQLISRLRVALDVEIPLRAVFESPTVTQLDQTITQLRTQDRGLTLPPIQAIEGNREELPLSWAQERLWFLNQLEGSTATYNIPVAVRIAGNLDINALQQALSEIVRRHEILRTSFPTVNGTPRQVIHPEATMNINMVDLQQLAGTERETVEKQLAREEAITPFSLENAPLIRCSLLQLSANEYVLLLTMHHIVSDGWSMGVFIQELSAIYSAFCAQVPSELPELSLQYADFAVWQRKCLSGVVRETQLNYWRDQLHDAPSLLQLPTDRPRPTVQTHRGKTQSWTLNTDLTQKLQTLSAESGTTLFMTLYAAFATLLYRYSGQSDILIGFPIANRNRSEIESLIGFFVNTLVLRTRLSANLSMKCLLAQVRETTLQAYEHQDVPFEQVVEALQPQRSLSHSPLFQVMFVLQNAPMGEVELPGVTLCQLERSSTIAKFDLTLSITETSQGLVGEWEYNTDLFDGSTIERMAGHFQNLLSAIVENPLAPVSELPLLSAAERHQLLVEWNDTAAVYPKDQCIHQLFEEQVELTPDAVAVVFEQQQLTYQQLNTRANQLAHYLQSLGVEPEVLVGICVERSVEMVVGLLGILKAGGAYVPLDPNYPAERLSYMLDDSGVEVLLTQQELLSSLPSSTAQTVCLDRDWGVIELQSQFNLNTAIGSDNLAYVIYTSGSTGQPKGTCIIHRGVVRLVRGNNYAHLSQTEVFLQLAPISFDASTFEIWGSLLNGGKLVVFPSQRPSLQELGQAIKHYQIKTLWLTAGLFHLMVDEGLSDLKSLSQVLAGGDVLSVLHVKKALSDLKNCQLINGYGPTENTTFTCCYSITENTGLVNSVPIGRPIANTQVYLLDDRLQPVPIGVIGEIYIGGDGLARGYLNRPELTDEKFLPNPFAQSKQNSRLYKTGDLARYRADSNIEYIGRGDDQVKIRGFRIELGEIEAVLSQHPVVLQTVVIAREDVVGDKRLVAYLVVKAEQVPSPSELRGFLKQQLPEYMVPAAFVTLDTLPLTPNGKIDKKALPIPDGVYQEQEYVAPRTPSEEIIANIFASILGVKNVGIHDNFFTLGGHSLLATQLISRLRVALDVEIPLRAVFESPTVTQLDQTITQLRTQDRGLTLPPIQAIEGNREELPLSWAQERLWFLNQLEGSTATYNIPVAVRIAGNLDINALQQALSEIVRRHEILRTSFPTVNGTPRQVIHPEATMNINMVDLQQLAGTERETVEKQLAREEAITPFSLENAPLIRCSLLQLSANEYVLLLTMHHIVSDGWSMGVFIQELSAIYSAFCAQVPSELPELSLQYADFAVWQRKCLSGVVRETQLNYWRDQLHDAPSLLQLPTDRPRPTVQTHRGKTQSWTLNTDLTQKLQTLSAESGTTLFMTLYAAFATLLYRYSGQSDILIGFPIANRNRSEIESLIGFFVNTLVLRTRLSANLSMKCLLAQVRETTLQAYEHQDVPFEQVVEALQPQRSLSHSPLFQVMFVLQNAPMGEVELPGVTLCQLERSSTIAKFDLTLSITETSQGLVGEWEYNTDLFDGSTIERMAGHFQNLLSAIVENPLAPVSELPLLSAAERHQLLVEWNDTAAVYPKDQCIHQLFEEQVELTPDAVAVVFEQQQLTYQQLNTRANQLAHYLQSLGVEPEVLVGICVERSVEMVVGLLGILKAGGAYVPLDPNYPAERLAYILSDACVSLLLTQQQLLPNLTKYDGRVVYLEEHWDDNNLSNPHSGVRANNLAYTVYTSGSTGRPKGVQIEHRSLLNLVQWHQKAFAVSAQDRVTQIAGVAFDAFGWEIFPTLSAGASIYFADEETRLEPDALQDWLVSKEITISFLPTPLAEKILLLDWSNNVALRTLLTGGDKLHQYPLASHPFAVVNNYGPTENTVVTTSGHVPVQLTNQSTPAIGRPIANTQVYLLDDRLQPVPIGVIGEIYIGGDGLARGYLNRPELTDEKFLPNPFHPSQSPRLYRTGDLAHYLPDGNIEFLGRIDNQVKIRGFRIELGEIEAVLHNHSQIQIAVVIVREDIPDRKRLVAYVVTADESLNTHQLREDLKQKLPEYMVPSTFVFLETLPLTPNGKIDRKALPAPDEEITRTDEYIAPRTEIELILSKIWQELLLTEEVGIHDNFFSLGGDSILSIQLVSRAKNSGIQITPRQIFQNQTIAELARVANTTVRVNAQQGIVTGTAPLTPIQQWFFAQNHLEAHHYNQSFLLRLPQNLSNELLALALKKLLEHHDALRLRFRAQTAEYPQIDLGKEESVPLSLVDLSSTPLPEQAQALEKIATEYQASLNLSTGPLVRVVVFNLGRGESRLLIIIHHLAVDGVSWRIIISDLATIYQQIEAQQPIKLSAKTTAFQDWAVKLNKYAQSEILFPELDYWLNQPWEQATPLLLDYAYKGENTVGSAAAVSVKLSVEDTSILLGSVNAAYNTQINDILLSALVKVLAQWTANATILIDLEGHGREDLFEDVDLSRTVGWFTSLFPVLLKIPDLKQPESIIKSIKEQLRAIPKRGIGYGILRYLCAETTIQEQIQRIPTPEISFNYLGQFDQVQAENGWLLDIKSTGANQSPRQNRAHLLDINALVIEGELQISWTYGSQVHHRATVENLAHNYLQALRTLIEHCQCLKSQPENLPLSASQEWSWFNDHPYITTSKFTYYITGSLNVAALEQSVNEIVRRHDILRTTFPIVDGKPVQVVAPTLTLTVPVIDLKELSGTEKAHKSAQLFESESLRPFDLECGPLIRPLLLQVGQQEYLLSFFFNHIIFDGFSLSVFIKELSVLYNAFDKGLPSGLEQLPFQFVDFVHWQQQYISGEVKEIYDDYWKNKLADAQPIFEPSRELGKLLPAIAHPFELSTNLINSLRKMGRKENVSLFIIMLTAFKLLLHIYTGKNDIVVGIINANRNPFESKFLIGFFANRVLLRTNLDGNPSFRELLVRVSDVYFESYDYQSLPNIQSGIAAIDHAQVFFNFAPIPKNIKYPPILQTKLVGSGGGAKVTEQDLNLSISDEEDRVQGMLFYTNRLFDAKTIEHLVNLYRQILEQVVEL